MRGTHGFWKRTLTLGGVKLSLCQGFLHRCAIGERVTAQAVLLRHGRPLGCRVSHNSVGDVGCWQADSQVSDERSSWSHCAAWRGIWRLDGAVLAGFAVAE